MHHINIGEKLILVEGARKWAIYDFQQNNIFRFNRKVGTLLKLISEENARRIEKMNFIEERHPALFEAIKGSKLEERLFVIWNANIPLESYRRKMLWLEVTDKCTYQCVHCYSLSNPTNDAFLNAPKIIDIIREAFSLRFDVIQFTGGEPLLHPNIIDIMQEASKCKFNVIELYSNLSLLNDRLIGIIKDNNIHVATTMLGSCSEIFDKCSGVPGSFDKWAQNVLTVKANGIPLRISIVRMKQNQGDMQNIKNFLTLHSLLNTGDLSG